MRHCKNCGCFSKTFLCGARTNFYYCLLQAKNSPDEFALRMCNLGKYYAHDIHTWDGGQCDFHALKSCTCGSCADDNVICSGEDYHSKYSLTCPFHALRSL